MTEVPVIVFDHLTPTQRRALVLADNRLALNAGWDEEMLRVELESLEEDGFDLDLVGFTDEEIEELLRDPEETFEGLTDDDAIPEEPERAVTLPCDVWLMGEHANRGPYNLLAWGIAIVVGLLSLALIAITILGWLGFSF